MSDWVDVTPVERLPHGESLVVDVNDVMIAVFNIDGNYFAIEDICTHDGAQLTGGKIDGDQIVCPRHGARFSIKTGEALTPPAYEPVATFPVRVNKGIVQIKDDRWD
ncbi:MAG: non-heme iron oxygenase ferredoxin subunit [Gammaproteobacteria bacterium]|nr:non-heme iron oxygenase ferredoxin subunit [Gammaproteobacteria bacterium]MCI0591099.1 non-heme iron oxygenase ferredoxin subunit [Gammaproteobacteria bacterium]